MVLDSTSQEKSLALVSDARIWSREFQSSPLFVCVFRQVQVLCSIFNSFLYQMCPSCPALMESHVQKTITKFAKENPDLEEIYLAKLEKSTKDVNADYNLDRRGPIQKCLDDLVEILKERKKGEWVSGPVFTRADAVICIYVQWVKWQIGWDADLTLHPSLEEFYDEVKDRECIVKTFGVEGPRWVGYYWRDRLVPVQRASLQLLWWLSVVLPMQS